MNMKISMKSVYTILQNIDGKPLRIKDIADVVQSNKEREILTTTDGIESVQIDIYKEADANMVALANNVIRQNWQITQRRCKKNLPNLKQTKNKKIPKKGHSNKSQVV